MFRYTFLMLIAGQLMPDHLERFLCIAQRDLSYIVAGASNLPAAFRFDWRANYFIFAVFGGIKTNATSRRRGWQIDAAANRKGVKGRGCCCREIQEKIRGSSDRTQ